MTYADMVGLTQEQRKELKSINEWFRKGWAVKLDALLIKELNKGEGE